MVHQVMADQVWPMLLCRFLVAELTAIAHVRIRLQK